MKRIYIVRHAQAASSKTGRDIDRELTDKGRSDALALGKYLCSKKYEPDIVICSSATRTKLTCEAIVASNENFKVQHSEEVYSAHCSQIFSMLQGLDDSIQSIMIIGHNPTVYELAAKLSAQGSENYISRLSMGYPPASLSVIDAPIDKWAELDPDACTLKDMALASEYNGAERPTRWM